MAVQAGPLARANLLSEHEAATSGALQALAAARRKLARIIGAGVLLCVALTVADGWLRHHLAASRAQLTRLRGESGRLSDEQKESQAAAARKAFLDTLASRRARWTEAIAATQTVPAQVWVNRLGVQEASGSEALTLEGFATTISVLPGFLDGLRRSAGGKEARIEQVSEEALEGRRVIRFRCQVTLAPPETPATTGQRP